MNNPTVAEIAIANDTRLLLAAEYDISQGRTINVPEAQIIEKFVEYKKTIMEKKTSLQDIENTIYKKYGIIELPSVTTKKHSHNKHTQKQKVFGF